MSVVMLAVIVMCYTWAAHMPSIHYTNVYFLQDRPWIPLWVKLISNELDITIYMITSQLSGQYDVINNRLWCYQQNKNRASETRGWCVKIAILLSFMDSLCHVLLRRTVSMLTRVLIWCLFPSLLQNSGNKHQNNHLVSAGTVCHWSAYIILFVFWLWVQNPSHKSCMWYNLINTWATCIVMAQIRLSLWYVPRIHWIRISFIMLAFRDELINKCYSFLWRVIIHPCLYVYGHLAKLPLNSKHVWVITSHGYTWV